MRIEQLEISGLRSHRGTPPTCLDLTGKELVAVVGQTGAGKSSLLEAVTFALFGESTYSGQAYEELSSDGRTEMSVRMVFTIGDDRYQLARTVRPDRNGDFKPKEIYLRRIAEDGTVVMHVDGVRKVNEAVSKLLGGITKEQFCQAVLLAQNRFAAFLEADPRERNRLLDALLGLTALKDAGTALQTTRKAVQRNIERLTDQRGLLPANPTAEARRTKRRAQEMTTVADRAEESADQLGALSERAAALTKETEELTAAATLRATSSGPDGLERLGHAATALTDLVTTDDDLRGQEEKVSGEFETAKGVLKRTTEDLATAETEHGTLAQHTVVAEQLQRLGELLAQIPVRERESSEAQAALTACREAFERAEVAAKSARTVTEAERERVGKTEAEAALRRTAVADAEQAVTRAADIFARLRKHVDLVDAAHEALSATNTRIAQVTAKLGPITERRDQARRTLDLAQRSDAAASVAHGCQPGDDCPVCKRPLPAAWVSPESGNLDEARTMAADAAEEFDTTTSELRTVGEHRAGVVSRLTTALSTVTATRDEMVMLAGKCTFASPPEAVTALEPAQDEPGTLDSAAEAAHGLAIEVGTWLESVSDTVTPLREVCEQSDRMLKDAQRALKQAETAQGVADKAVSDANAALAGAVSTHDGRLRVLEDARTSLASTIEVVDKRWRKLIDPAVVESLAAATGRLEEDRIKVEAATTARDDATIAVTICERAAQELSKERAEKITAPLASLTATLAGLIDLVNNLAARVDTAPAAAAGGSPAPATLLEATSDIEATAVAAVEAASVRIAALRMSVADLVAPASDVVTTLVGLMADADPTGNEIGEVPDLGDPLGSTTYARVQQIVGRARRLAEEAAAAAQTATDAVSIAQDLDKRIKALTTWRADVDGGIEVLKKDAFPTWARSVRITDLVETASEIFSEMTSSRYRFDETLRIADEQAGAHRKASSLSGGEKFEAALALALGVAEIAGRSGVRIDTLFLDEGFAGLDQSHLNRTIDALESQVEAGRCIVLITHIGSVADRIRDVLLVQDDGVKGSTLKWLNEEERFELGADLDIAVP